MKLNTLKRPGSGLMALFVLVAALFTSMAAALSLPAQENEAKTYKIVLDPGHDSSHNGAHYGSLKEETLNLTVAKYCKAELKKYKNVKVYMTRSGASCPHNASSAASDDNYARCVYASNVKADAYISIHMNSSDNGSANGVEVYYQQRKYTNYNNTAAKKSLSIAKQIRNRIVKTGLSDRGVKYRVTENNSKYPNGSLADYYAVIKYNRINKIPAVIVEHAFITGSKDYKFLSKKANLKKLGVADAEGVAAAFGLTKSSIPEGKVSSIKSSGFNNLKVSWSTLTGAEKYLLYRSEKKDGTYTKIANTAKTSYTDKTCTPGVKYYYKVLGYKGEDKGPLSDAKAATAPQAKVSGTDISAGIFNQTVLKWSPRSDATGYFVYRKKSNQTEYTKIATLEKDEDTYTDGTSVCGKTYNYKICAYLTYGDKNYIGAAAVLTRKIPARKTTVSLSQSGTNVVISWKKVTEAEGYRIYRKTSSDAEYTRIRTINDIATLKFTDKNAESGTTYTYMVRGFHKTGSSYYMGTIAEASIVTSGTASLRDTPAVSEPAETDNGLHAILASSNISAAKMVNYYNSKVPAGTYPASVYASKGAATINAFADIVVEEANAEGVLPELVFAQVCQETGYLKFGGQVKSNQCNFAGLGATNGGAAGATFPDVRTGIRAQVQHLKLYANPAQTKDGFKNPCVDQRFSSSLAGKAPYIEWLDMRNNPNNPDKNNLQYGWALTDDNSDYGAILLKHMEKIKNS